MKLIGTFTCVDSDGDHHEVQEYAEVINAPHMQGASAQFYGMREYRLVNGIGLRPLGGDKFHCQSLMTEMTRLAE